MFKFPERCCILLLIDMICAFTYLFDYIDNSPSCSRRFIQRVHFLELFLGSLWKLQNRNEWQRNLLCWPSSTKDRNDGVAGERGMNWVTRSRNTHWYWRSLWDTLLAPSFYERFASIQACTWPIVDFFFVYICSFGRNYAIFLLIWQVNQN